MVSSIEFLVVVITFSALTEGVIVPFKDCGSKLGKVNSLDFNCDHDVAKPCTFTKEKSYSGKISITPNTVINNGTIVFHAIIGGLPLPFPFPSPDLCKNHGVVCPLKANTAVEIELTLAVPDIAPTGNLVPKIEIQVPSKEDVMCIEFLAVIVSN